MAKDEEYRETVDACRSMVLVQFKGDEIRARAWFMSPNPLLGYDTPDRWIMCNKAHQLLEIIKRAMESYGRF